MSEVARHEEVSFDLTCPRQYTARGGWNISCECGAPLGDTGYSDDEWESLRQAHLAEMRDRPAPAPARPGVRPAGESDG